ncbi:MAG: FkbM family methyltransferase [Bacillota bacterium]
MKEIVRKYFPWAVRPIRIIFSLFRRYYRKSYSQFGEDMVLSSLIWQRNIKKGFYVDIGCFAPKKLSNTYFYYKKGWRGINVDARPGSMRPFMKLRKRDINVESGISDEEDELKFHIFEEAPLNTFSDNLASECVDKGMKLEKSVIVHTMTLEQLFNRYLPKNQHIDFLTIDVEGFDYRVLKSNNWEKYKPTFILIEMHNLDFESVEKSQIYIYLNYLGYKLVSIAYITLIFERK